MSGLLPQEIEKYRNDGYVIPQFRLSDSRISSLRETLDELIQKNPGVRPERLVNAHIEQPNAEGVRGCDEFLQLARDPDILNLVEGALGPDIILWGCHLFCKPAGNGLEVPWHQDGEYWPIRPLATCTVWIALDDSQSQNGCLRVVPGSHRDRTVYEHGNDERDDLVLNYRVTDEQLDPENMVDVELKAGEMSLHDVYMIHGSNPNHSANRRAGLALRYMPGSSVFERNAIEPGDDAGFTVDFSRRPLWLMRGKDQTGRNDFEVGHTQ